MHMPRILVTSALFIVLAGCAVRMVSSSLGSDFSVKGNAAQQIPLGEAAILLVRCYCPEIALKRAGTTFVEINVEAVHDSVGYHGKQSKPTVIPLKALQFNSYNDRQTLSLESHEYTSMHHALLVKHLALTVPPELEVRIVQIPYKALEGRVMAPEGAASQ